VIALLLVLATGGATQDTLRFAPGIHPGPLVISRPTIILGQPGAVLHGDGRGTVLTILARGTVVRGLRIEASGRDLDRDDAGVMVRADSVTIEDVSVRDVLHGIYVRQARNVVLRRLDLAGPAGLRESESGNGIHLWSVRAAVIGDVRVVHFRDGIFLEYADSVRVSGSTVSRVRFGLHYMFSHDNRFEGNTFTDNAAGAVVMYSNRLVIADNVFAWNSGSRSYGLVLQNAIDPVVQGNALVGNGIGVFFDNVIRGRFTENVVAGNWLGLQLFANTEQTVVTRNALVANTFDATGGGTAGAYVFCVAGRGNYWSKAAAQGYDLDGDGSLDAPHAASAPLAELARDRGGLRLFLASPAARVLEWAERTFPVFDVGGAEDACPLAQPPALPALARMPSAPAGRDGGRQAQGLAGAAVFGFGLFALTARRRKGRRA
jgi:nitrous oxidase accessory protein